MIETNISEASVILRGLLSEQEVDIVFSSKMKAKIFLGYLKKITNIHCKSPTSQMKFRTMRIEDRPIDPYIANRYELKPLFFMKIRNADQLDIIELSKCEKIEDYIKYLESEVELEETNGRYYICHIFADNEMDAVNNARELIEKDFQYFMKH